MDPGTWTDHGLVFRSYTGDAYNAVDPNLAVDEHGRPFLSFGNARFLRSVARWLTDLQVPSGATSSSSI
jgi:beta-xylosidase